MRLGASLFRSNTLPYYSKVARFASLNIHELEFITKRQLVEALNLRGTLACEDSVKVLYLH